MYGINKRRYKLTRFFESDALASIQSRSPQLFIFYLLYTYIYIYIEYVIEGEKRKRKKGKKGIALLTATFMSRSAVDLSIGEERSKLKFETRTYGCSLVVTKMVAK